MHSDSSSSLFYTFSHYCCTTIQLRTQRPRDILNRRNGNSSVVHWPRYPGISTGWVSSKGPDPPARDPLLLPGDSSSLGLFLSISSSNYFYLKFKLQLAVPGKRCQSPAGVTVLSHPDTSHHSYRDWGAGWVGLSRAGS